MPNYSLTRTTQYTTTAQLQTKANQTNFDFDGYDQHAYASSFPTNIGASSNTVCPVANRLWDYSTPASPVPHYVWYPYSMSMAACGGGVYYPNTGGSVTYRPGYAYFKLYNSSGTFLMGTTTNTLSVHSPNNVIIVGGPGWYLANAVLATTQIFNNSRNTLTITGATTYVAGLANPSTATSFWTVYAEIAQSGQNVYYDTGVTMSGNMTLTVETTGDCQMGFITYNNAPQQPTSVVFSTMPDGISVTCQSNEINSLYSTTGSLGAVSRVSFFYSDTAGGTYTYLGSDTSISRALSSGTTYTYAASITGGTTLNQGGYYYFKVALMNDVCIQYQLENSTAIAAGQQSAQPASPTQYGTGGFVTVYDGVSSWNPAPIWVHNGTSWVQNNAAFAKSDGTGGFIFN